MRSSPELCVWLTGLMLASALVGCGRPSAPPTEPIVGDATAASLSSELSLPSDSFAAWRNLDSDGLEDDRDVPVQWAEGKNVRWQTDVPGSGHSSPIVSGDQVFVTSADESQKTQSVLAFGRDNGEAVWSVVAHQGELPRMHKKNTHASSTPACDGTNVFAAFIHGDALHVTAVSCDGEITWQREVGPFESEHGYGSSVVLWKGLLFVAGDSPGNGYLAALDRGSGEIVWRTPREGAGGHGSYSTPLVAELAGRTQLLHSGYNRVVSYDPATGKEIWRCDGPAEVTANTMVSQDPLVVVSGGYPEKEILCIDASGTGDVTDTGIVWRSDRNATYVPSPTIRNGNLYSLSDDGILAAFAMETGERIWQKRIGGNFSASPLVIGDRFYAPSESGEVHVFTVDPDYQSVAVNRLGDSGGMASIAVSGDELIVRTSGRLHCLAKAVE